MVQERVAVVTGGNRGLGLEVVRRLARQADKLVVLTCRDAAAGEAVVDMLQKEELAVRFFPLDVTHAGQIRDLAAFLREEFGRCDILINNAGIFPDVEDQGTHRTTVFRTHPDTIRRAMETNVYGPLLLCQAVIPLMRLHGYGRIVNVSSGLAQLSTMGGGAVGYRISKTALNVLTRVFAAELPAEDNILINSVNPGWVRTRMGGQEAPRSVEEGAAGIVWAATLPDGGPTGRFFLDGKEIPW